MGRESIGELEHLILLAIAALRADASALGIRARLDEEGRSLTRGALYRSLDRLEDKALLQWQMDEPDRDRGGHPRRLYALTEAGRDAVLERRATLERLWAAAGEGLR